MSKDENVTEATNTVTLEQLNYFWATDGLPVFYADRYDIEDVVEDLGFSIYYLICNIAEDKETKSTSTTYSYNGNSPYTVSSSPTLITEKTTSIVKVVSNIIGKAVSQVSTEIADLAAIRETAEYTLPGIPLEIVNRLDDFFRLVDAQHGTESIVLLTFDPSKKDSTGWGVLVPEQTNTSVHCNYNPDSIVDEKPDNVLIVGSVHSHPGMAAYASGTDHADQVNFDGLHITYGWQKTVSGGATQYYIEMQMGGNSWTLKPEDVFEGYVANRDPDSLVVEWSTKVKKVHPPTGGSAFQAASHNTQTRTHHSGKAGTLGQQVTLGSTAAGTTKSKFASCYVPDAGDKTPHLIMAELDPHNADLDCPACDYALSDYDLTSGSCPVCDLPLVSMNDGFKDVLIKAEKYLAQRYMTGDRNVYLWVTDEVAQTMKGQLMKISSRRVPGYTSGASIVEEYAPYRASEDEDDDEGGYYGGFDPDKTICCFRSPSKCTCPKTVLFDDINDFERQHDDVEIYNPSTDCLTCQYQYTSDCPYYYEALVDFVTDGIKLSEPITPCYHYKAFDHTASSIDIN